ncbi:hypothetical protein A3F08_03160 [Candidatus Berkelbacteria bacterium RIFCSPHIGHO2_12_FULL_36_9]|uniref:Uncharacterized protein n=1 Tax=Candidatus Berkelbacteria bacterium RIFCSPHIGHO2_12_FULL_36_9 TaxID=1797469 RepID=A0A1F5EFQ7_9BACT|nr:MAG: hypothetical protein A3F08_03160 [Candidatus Berkelbacteria bacterium RIFCSPHIGHO2_12_FULL_36_9]
MFKESNIEMDNEPKPSSEKLISELEKLWPEVNIKMPELSRTFDLESLKQMEGFSEEEKVEHIEHIKKEILNSLPEDLGKEISQQQSYDRKNFRNAIIGLLSIFQVLSASPALAESPYPTPRIERKDKGFNSLQEFKIGNQAYRFGIAIDPHGEFGGYKKFAVIGPDGKDVFPEGESTWAHELDGFYIGNLLSEKGQKIPEIITWHRISDAKEEQIRGNFYKWSKKQKRFVIYHSNLTNKKYSTGQEKEIREGLLAETKFTRSYKTLREFLDACRNNDWGKIKKMLVRSGYSNIDAKVERSTESNLRFLQEWTPQIYEARTEGQDNFLAYFIQLPNGTFLRIYSSNNQITVIDEQIK